MFEFDEIEVLSANSGKDAWEVVNNHDISLIVSDIKMPNGTGIDLLKKVTQSHFNIPVVLVTGYSELKDQELIELGAIEVLDKPVDYESLKSIIFENI